MAHLQVQVPNRDAASVTRRIAAEGLLHLVDIAHGRITADAAPPGTRELLAAFRDILRRARQMAERLELTLPEPAGSVEPDEGVGFEQLRDRLEQRLRPMEAAVDDAARRAAVAHDRARRAERARTAAERLRAAGVESARLSGLRFSLVRLGVLPVEELPALAALLAPAPFALVPLETEGTARLVAAAVPSSGRARLEDALRLTSFEALPLAPDGSSDPAAVEAEIVRARQDEALARDDLARSRGAMRAPLEEVARRAQTAMLLLQAQTQFAGAGRFVVISGWVPVEALERMRAAIQAASGGRAVIEVERPEDMAEAELAVLGVPILHRNPMLLRPFQKLVQLYGTPGYRELEPTAFFAVSFLLMFGLMFGDLGHGLVLFAAGYCLFRWVPRFLDYGILLMEGGAASSLFGVLYGSVFGIEGLLPTIWLQPLRDLPRFMAVAVGMGVVLVSGGLLLNVANTWRSGERANALLGPHGLFGAFVYWVVLALVGRWLLPSDVQLPAGALVALAAVPVALLLLKPVLVRRLDGRRRRRTPHAASPPWLAALEAAIELVDAAFTYFANTISFVRVAAFAAVHAGVLIAIFALSDTLGRMAFAGGAASVLALVAGNVLVILLEGLTVSVQVLRLEYYEFFSKFFRGGGEPYRPLMLHAAAGKESHAPHDTAPDASPGDAAPPGRDDGCGDGTAAGAGDGPGDRAA
jgi:V/A-type H+-transporting ATPase subunit I